MDAEVLLQLRRQALKAIPAQLQATLKRQLDHVKYFHSIENVNKINFITNI